MVDHVRSEARAFGHQVVTETQAEATRFKHDLERQAREILASATTAVGEAEARSYEAESNDEAQFLRLQNQQLQAERPH